MTDDPIRKGPRTTLGITVGEMIEQLRGWPEDMEVYAGGLTFYRFKQRGDKLLQLEFGEQVYRDTAGNLFAEDVEPAAPPEPALTPAQWDARYAEESVNGGVQLSAEGGPGKTITIVHGEEPEIVVPHELVHPLAALCLAEEPFGFDQVDVDDLREIAEDVPELRAELLRSIASRIAALVPPQRADGQ